MQGFNLRLYWSIEIPLVSAVGEKNGTVQSVFFQDYNLTNTISRDMLSLGTGCFSQ